jgi:hypothetical protein
MQVVSVFDQAARNDIGVVFRSSREVVQNSTLVLIHKRIDTCVVIRALIRQDVKVLVSKRWLCKV